MTRRAWLLKTEPEDYSWDDLVQEQETEWDGVRAPKALSNLSAMKAGDQVFIYHTGRERAVVGLGRVTSDPYPDPGEENPRYLLVKVAPETRLLRPVTLKEIKESGLSPQWELVRLPRLSVVPVGPREYHQLLIWGGLQGEK